MDFFVVRHQRRRSDHARRDDRYRNGRSRAHGKIRRSEFTSQSRGREAKGRQNVSGINLILKSTNLSFINTIRKVM